MSIPGPKPSVHKASVEARVFTPTGLAEQMARPADLSEDAAPIWDVLLADLCSMGIYRESDGLLLAEMCELLAEVRRLRKAMDNPSSAWPKFETRMSAEERDDLRALPEDELKAAWPMSNSYRRLRTSYTQALQAVKSLVGEFGVTPVARLRLGLLAVQGASLTDMFSGSSYDAPPVFEGEVL